MSNSYSTSNENTNILINETKRILEKSYEDYQNINQHYYDNVLQFLNLLFAEESKSILKIKFKKITLNEKIFNMYNDIIKKHKLNKNLFDTKNFNIEDIHDFSEIIEIAKIMCNNLLNKLNYKFDVITYNNAKKLKITIINNGF
jgi:virulence-associated protein VapD